PHWPSFRAGHTSFRLSARRFLASYQSHTDAVNERPVEGLCGPVHLAQHLGLAFAGAAEAFKTQFLTFSRSASDGYRQGFSSSF
ncbi:hypothetical protein, partial [Mesorhizobium sp.]|uniref:hypothetical protein n=1 Tax=Mesorhizobium sp. TaxID=1871066 RepID=UPI0025C09087